MSLTFNDYNKTQVRTGVARPPAMMLKELADKRGISYTTLRRKFKATGQGVEITMKGKAGRIYYNALQLEVWANEHLRR